LLFGRPKARDGDERSFIRDQRNLPFPIMNLSDFQFELPPELIAMAPVEPRDQCRLLVVHRATGRIEHRHFFQLADYFGPEDLLILNNSKVIPARLMVENGAGELLLTQETSPGHWLAIGRPAKRLKAGMVVTIDPLHPGQPPAKAEILRTLEDGQRVVRLIGVEKLEDYGQMPLPPYIQKAREQHGLPVYSDQDDAAYQTIYAEKMGSVAAPTAGLHFTPELLEKFNHAFVTLHVGLGTFRQVKTERLEDHDMHDERFSIPEGLKEKAAAAKRVVAVGTTSARVIESVPDLRVGGGTTKIFIYPPYKPKRVDALVTNFHLPGSTLLMLVAGFLGLELQREVYRAAIADEYRFYSYGDAMLIL
jgi:S-adenosylmethionine:tRNA ribosyltransferase-isomerase